MMTTNRHLLNDLEIVRPMQLLDKGLPLPFLEGKYVVDQGWCAVITEGGAYKEILMPGTHFLGKYKFFRDVKATQIDLRIKTLTVSTMREFTISQPVPVEINLDLAVEYRVADPRRVATELTTPMTSLFDRVIQAVRGSVVYATVDEIRTQGEGIARSALQRLQAMQLPSVIGLEVLNVLTTSIKATDAGQDALAQLQMSEFTKVQDWRVDNMIVQQTQVTPQWLMINRPDLYAQLAAGNLEVMKEMIDKGLLDPAGFLNQSASAPGYNPNQLLGNMGLPGMGTLQPPAANQPQGYAPPGQPAPGGPTAQLPQGQPTASGGDVHARMRDEIGYLERLPGAKVDTKPGVDQRGIADGSYDLRIQLPRSSGGLIVIYITVSANYPQTPPASFEVEVNNELTPFQSANLRRWNGQYLVEIVREVKQFFS
jgi:hypothetical protein